jgi:hypothetical protein
MKRFGVRVLSTLLVVLVGFGVGFGIGCGTAIGQTAQIAAKSVEAGSAGNGVQAGTGQARSSQARYIWKSVQIVGGGFVDGVIFHPTAAGVRYARTDMGGAYRWDAAAKRWQPILDWVPYKDLNLMGVESIAVDPAHRESGVPGVRDLHECADAEWGDSQVG